jgi:ribosomal protein L11 methyltransferase
MWLSVSLEADAERADALSDALLTQGAITVSVEDALAGTPDETPQFGEPGSAACDALPLWSRSRVSALFEPGSNAGDLDQRVAAACASVGMPMPPSFLRVEVAEQNWVQLTQSQFEPIRINRRLWIVPSWHVAPDPAAINLLLDPGMAFGTGSHPTTRLCLEWLCNHVRGGESVLDYGCGSGILAIAAARLGAGQVLAVDIDDNALAAARDNAAANHVTLELRHSRSSLEETFDCVVANILTNPLCLMAPLLSARISTHDGNAGGGCMALSGILECQADQVIAAYAPLVQLTAAAAMDGWVLLEGRREGRAA